MRSSISCAPRAAAPAGAPKPPCGPARWSISIPTAFREHRHVIRQDLRHALRILASSPAFTAVAVLSLALGIGANAAIFSLLNGVLMSTLPVPAPHELVMLTDPNSAGVSIGSEGGERSLLTYAEFVDVQSHADTLASVMASSSGMQRVEARVAGGEPEELEIRLASSSYFRTLGVAAMVGRTFDAEGEPAEGDDAICRDQRGVLAAPFRRARRRPRSADCASWRPVLDHRRDAALLLRRDGGRTARRLDASFHAGDRAARPSLAPRSARQRRESDVAARLRASAARRHARAGTGQREPGVSAGLGRLLRLGGRRRPLGSAFWSSVSVSSQPLPAPRRCATSSPSR